MKKLFTITSHAGHSRYLGEVGDHVGYIPRHTEIPSPYASGPNHVVYVDPKRGHVIIVETSHKTFKVFAVNEKIYRTDKEATDVYIASLKTKVTQ